MINTSPSRERVGNIYFTEDYPVLLEAGRWEISGRLNNNLRPELIASALNRNLPSVLRSIGRLSRAGYLETAKLTGDNEEYHIILQLTQEGLRECGAWPEEGHLADVLLAVLECEATEADKVDPEKGRKIRKVLESAGDVSTTVLAKIAAELLKSISFGP